MREEWNALDLPGPTGYARRDAAAVVVRLYDAP
jgi:hypothetical protein